MIFFKPTISLLIIFLLSACQVDSKDSVKLDTTKLNLESVFSKTFNESIIAVDISNYGKQFLAGGEINKIRFRSDDNFNLPVEVSFEHELTALQFVGESNHIFFAHKDGRTRLFDSKLRKLLDEHRFPKSARFSSINEDSTLIVYGIDILLPEQDNFLPSTVLHASQSSLQLSKQRHVLTAGYHDSRVVVRDSSGQTLADWRLNDSVQTAVYQKGPFKKLFRKKTEQQIRRSPLAENNWLGTGFDNGSIQLLDGLRETLLVQTQLGDGNITSIDINSSAKLIMAGSYEGSVGLFKIQNQAFDMQ